jgi:hypothetical protein
MKHTSKNIYSVPQQSNDFHNMLIAFTRVYQQLRKKIIVKKKIVLYKT